MRESIFLTLREGEIPTLAATLADMVCQKLTPIIQPPHQNNPEDLLTRRDAAAYMNISVSTISRFTRDGHLICYKPEAGRRVLYRRADLDQFIVAHRR